MIVHASRHASCDLVTFSGQILSRESLQLSVLPGGEPFTDDARQFIDFLIEQTVSIHPISPLMVRVVLSVYLLRYSLLSLAIYLNSSVSMSSPTTATHPESPDSISDRSKYTP